jgi:hypothetical protein
MEYEDLLDELDQRSTEQKVKDWFERLTAKDVVKGIAKGAKYAGKGLATAAAWGAGPAVGIPATGLMWGPDVMSWATGKNMTPAGIVGGLGKGAYNAAFGTDKEKEAASERATIAYNEMLSQPATRTGGMMDQRVNLVPESIYTNAPRVGYSPIMDRREMNILLQKLRRQKKPWLDYTA